MFFLIDFSYKQGLGIYTRLLSSVIPACARMTAEVWAKFAVTGFRRPMPSSFSHLFQFRKLGIQLFHALFAEVDGQSGGFAFVYGIDDDAGAEFGMADVLADAEACVGLRLFEVVDDFVPLYGGLARVAVAVVGGFFDGQVVQYFGWDFFDEAGDDAELGLSVKHALLRHGDVEAFAGAGDGDVHEAAFFFKAAAFGEAHFAGEAAFFHAGEEDGVKFQAFGGVDGHELDGFFACACLVFAGFEGGVAQESEDGEGGVV